jgi:hypothetical protein
MTEEFCDGVKILLKRMESNPEEFKGHDSKWLNVVPSPTGYADWSHALTTEELQALKDGVRKIYQDVFTAQVMQTLLSVDDAPKQPDVTTNPFRHSPNELARFGHTVYGNSIGVNASAGSGGTGLGTGTWVTTGTNTPVVTDSMLERFERVWNKYKKEGGK